MRFSRSSISAGSNSGFRDRPPAGSLVRIDETAVRGAGPGRGVLVAGRLFLGAVELRVRAAQRLVAAVRVHAAVELAVRAAVGHRGLDRAGLDRLDVGLAAIELVLRLDPGRD